MAKGSVTDQDLESSLKSLGGLGGIASSGARRDSPFGSEFARTNAPEAAPEVPTAPPESARPVKFEPAREVVVAPPPPAALSASVLPATEVQITSPVRAVSDPRPRVKARARPVETPPEIEIPSRKSDSFNERVTLQMSPDMRDDLNLTAAKLQRRKTDKAERITANTLMRVAIRILLDEVELTDGEVANSEADLLRIVKAKLLGT